MNTTKIFKIENDISSTNLSNQGIQKNSQQEIDQKRLEKILRKEKIYRFDKDIRLLTRKELGCLFSYQGRIPMTRLFKNIIWNAYERIQSGKADPIEGNLRTFYYLWIKPVLGHIEDDQNKKTNLYDVMLKMFARMVLDLKLFRYSDFDFTDENWQNRWIGESKPEVLVFAEKSGWVRFLKEINEDLGVSTIALGGFPSALTSEYTALHLQKKIKNKPIFLVGIVDFDPSGDLIFQAFEEQLKTCGLNISSSKTLIKPENGYTEKEVEMFKFRLPRKQKTKLKRWLQKTGGIQGQPFGLESESMKRSQVRKFLEYLLFENVLL